MNHVVTEMRPGIESYRLLQGYRGHPVADVEAIEEVSLRLSRLVEAIPEISELDLNPIFALPPGQGCIIVDIVYLPHALLMQAENSNANSSSDPGSRHRTGSWRQRMKARCQCW